MSVSYLCCAIALTALATYLPRVLPLVLFRKRIENRFVQSFLLYMPYAILAAMVFPAVFTSTGGLVSALGGTLGRTMSPIAGATIICAGIAGVDPMEVCKRNALGITLALLAGMVILLF